MMVTPIGLGCWQSQIALNWLLHYNGDTIIVIPGATKEIHVKENIGAMSFRLSDEDMARLYRLKQAARIPITKLVAIAIKEFLERKIHEGGEK